MSNTKWIVTAEGAQCGSFVVPIERLAKLRKGRYLAIKEVCSRFLGDENDVEFISTWREALQRAGIEIDEAAFRVTVKESMRMKAHRFVYAVARSQSNPYGDPLTNAGYFQRRSDPSDSEIEARTCVIMKTASKPKQGEEEHNDALWQPDTHWPCSASETHGISPKTRVWAAAGTIACHGTPCA